MQTTERKLKRKYERANYLIAAAHQRNERTAYQIICACQRNAIRREWIKVFHANTRMIRGWMPPMARAELEAAGNTVVRRDGRWVINPTGQQTLEGFR